MQMNSHSKDVQSVQEYRNVLLFSAWQRDASRLGDKLEVLGALPLEHCM